MGFEAGVGQVVLAGRDHERISGAVESAQAEVIVQMAGVVQRKTELGRRLGRTLAEHHKLKILEFSFSSDLCKGSKQKINSFTGIIASAHGAKQQQRAVLRQAEKLAS